MVMTGPPDSGKTSWLEPILAVLDRRHLATCTDEKKFSCQMINNETQLIWLDEWQAGEFLVSNQWWLTHFYRLVRYPLISFFSFRSEEGVRV